MFLPVMGNSISVFWTTGAAPTVERSSRYKVISSVPTGTWVFSIRPIICPRRCARNTPRRRIPTRPRPVAPLFFSMISWTNRTSVRSISDADINCAFSRMLGWRGDVRGVMNAASYAERAGRGKVRVVFSGLRRDAKLRENDHVSGRILDADFFRAVKGSAHSHRNLDALYGANDLVQALHLNVEEGWAFADFRGNGGYVFLGAGVGLVHQLDWAFLQDREAQFVAVRHVDGLLEAHPFHPEFQTGFDFLCEEYRCQFFYSHESPPFICLILRWRANEQHMSVVM